MKENDDVTVSLQDRILEIVKKNPGQTGRQIAQQLDMDRREVNKFLYGPLRSQVKQNNNYRWFAADLERAELSSSPSEQANTPLSRLCRYYLACLGQDETGVTVFADSKTGDFDYTELDELPGISGLDTFQGSEAQRLVGKLRRDRSRLAMYFGYPTSLRFVQSRRSSWKGFFAEPVFLFPVEMERQSGASPEIDFTSPIINQSVLRQFTNVEREALMDELVQLEEELGLSETDDPPEIDELVRRLAAIRQEWPWVETCDPDVLVKEPPLSKAAEAGIYNRAVLIVGERSPFTQGLEAELKKLAQLSKEAYANSALGNWIACCLPESEESPDKALLEVLPLNTEQREAIQRSLYQSLTIITGPPGTGKSQVVTDLLINAAWQGKRVLFASKNNKAVDVVEARVNNLGPRPILLRVGSNQYQTRLAEYLLGMLASTSGEDERQSFEESLEIQQRIESQLSELEEETQRFIDLRNQVDRLEQEAERARKVLPEAVFYLPNNQPIDRHEDAINSLRNHLKAATRTEQPWVLRLAWDMTKKSRYKSLYQKWEENRDLFQTFDIEEPDQPPDDTSIQEWRDFLRELWKLLELTATVRNYFQAMASLQQARSLETVAKEQAHLLEQLASNVDILWKNWLRLQPSRLNSEDRNKLSKYNALLKMIIDSGPDAKLSKKVYKEYTSLFPKVAHLLPCWAVTSLSARGKIPFESGFFDLVVFDEASQCDIASALPLLYRAKRAVIIGDPKQLSHISGLQRGQDQQLLDKYGLVADFANWAYSYNSLFDLASGLSSGEDIVNLRDHHRSHADVIDFSNRFFYEGRLRVATRYDYLSRPPGEKTGVRWENIEGKVSRPATGGAVNYSEAQKVTEVLKQLILDRSYRGSVGVVSPFRAQANLIREQIGKISELDQHLIQADFLADTVHKFQGDERDVMIFSPVLSTGISSGAVSFLRNNGNLFNVAITRARAMLVVVGDWNAAVQAEVDYLREFARYVENLQREEKQRIKQAEYNLGPDYPAVVNPERVSEWEIILYRALYEAGIPCIPQYQVEKYTLDLALIRDERRLNIEVDGERYHRNWTGELCRRDQIRNYRMFELGWDVMRFWVYEVRDDLDGCVARVEHWLKQSSEND